MPPNLVLAELGGASLADGDDVRRAAAGLIGKRAVSHALDALVDALDDPAPAVRVEAQKGLRAHGHDAAPSLAQAGGSWRARTEAAILLHELGDSPRSPAGRAVSSGRRPRPSGRS
jgi:HEAT repeat protein